MRWLRQIHRLTGMLLLAVLFAVPSTVLAGGPVCSATEGGRSISAAAGTSPTPEEPPEVPPTPNQLAVDGHADSFASEGTFDPEGTAASYPADLPGPATLASSEAQAVVEYVYRHRLTGSEDTVQALIARDWEVSQAYLGLMSTGRLATSADTDPATALHHLSLIRNIGTTGGFTVEGNQVSSIGVRCPPIISTCSNPGGFIYWPPGRAFNSCPPGGREEAAVYLTVRQSNGQSYRAFTTSYACGPTDRSSYGFRNVPSGSAEVIARPIRRCCQSGRTTFNLPFTCSPTIAMPCIPGRTNFLAHITMDPWRPPGFGGNTTPGASVWIANRDNACVYGSPSTADAQGRYTVAGCLPSGDLYVYAESGNLIGRVNVPDSVPCSLIVGPYNIPLLSPPKVVGHILNWQPGWYPNAGALARGCSLAGCKGVSAQTIVAPADQITGSYQLNLKPGRWLLYSYQNCGYQLSQRCKRLYGEVFLEAGQVLTIDLQPAVSACICE